MEFKWFTISGFFGPEGNGSGPPYRIVRNPLYVGSTTFFLGMGLRLRSVSVLLFAFGWVIFVHLFVVYFEEPDLQRKFGATYEAYCAGVPRWMPRVRRTKRAQ